MRRLLPSTATRDAPRLIATRAARGFADGIASVLLASYLSRLGFTPVQIGAIATATLLGSALLLLSVGLLGHRFARRNVLLASAILMCLTGIAFYLATDFWALLLVAFVGTLNPSSGDVTLFLPTEQAVLAEAAGCSEVSDPSSYWSWFPGCSWQVSLCRRCSAHLGWRFSGAARFYGLIVDRLTAP